MQTHWAVFSYLMFHPLNMKRIFFLEMWFDLWISTIVWTKFFLAFVLYFRATAISSSFATYLSISELTSITLLSLVLWVQTEKNRMLNCHHYCHYCQSVVLCRSENCILRLCIQFVFASGKFYYIHFYSFIKYLMNIYYGLRIMYDDFDREMDNIQSLPLKSSQSRKKGRWVNREITTITAIINCF